jgi:RNA polymerase-binding transcription factor DksA
MATKGTKSAVKKSGTRGGREKSPSRPRVIKKGKVPAKKATVARTAKPGVKKTVASRAVNAHSVGPKAYSVEDLRHFKELILAKRKETIEELDTLKESMMDVTTGEYISESSNYSLHMEQGTDAMEREKTFLFASRGSKFVNQLDDALSRIEAKTYGVCKACQLLVPKERLEAVPTAQTCAEYKNTGNPCERGRIALAKRRQMK